MSENTGNYLALAEAAEAAGNREEANQYFTKILEADPKDARAWLGKGSSAGWSSNLTVDRLRECISGMQKAIQFDAHLKAKAANTLTEILRSYYALSDSHTREFVTVDGTFPEHVERCQSILAAARQSYEWNPRSREPLDLVVAITDTLFDALANGFEDEPVLGPNEKYAEFLAEEKNWAVGEIKKLDPSYKETEVKSSGGCLMWSIAILVTLLAGFALLMFLAKMSAGD